MCGDCQCPGVSLDLICQERVISFSFPIGKSAYYIDVRNCAPSCFFSLKGVFIRSEAFSLWTGPLYPLNPLNYFSGLEGAGLQKPTLAGRRGWGGLRGAGLGGALGAGLTFSGTGVASAGRDLAEYSRHHKGEYLECG